MKDQTPSLDLSLNRINRYLNVLAQKGELSAARLEVLGIIQAKNPVTLRQLCDIQQVKMPTMSKLVDELQNEALVFRAQSKDDARQRWIVPTQKGLQVLKQETERKNQLWRLIFEGLTAEEKQLVERGLGLLSHQLGVYLSEATQSLSTDSSLADTPT